MEVQLGKETAQATAYGFANGDLGTIHDLTWGTAKDMLPALQSRSWREFGRRTEVVGLPKIKRLTDTETWLINVVAPTIARFRKDNPNSLAIRALRAALDIELSES